MTYLLLLHSASCGHDLDHFDHPRHRPSQILFRQGALKHKRQSQLVKLQVAHLDMAPESSTGSLLSALLRTAVLPAGFAGALVAPGLLVVVVTRSHLSKGEGGQQGEHN